MYVMFLPMAPVYIQHLYTEKKLTYIPAFQTCHVPSGGLKLV